MKNYLDLQDTNLCLDIELELVGHPEFTVCVDTFESTKVVQQYYLDLLKPFSIIIKLDNKIYTTEYETAVIIKRLSVDDISIIPEYTHLAEYDNDHGFTDPTSYIGFNGKWILTFDCPFYQWLHQAQNQGWLIG
jgi:hypothetical protein